MRPRVLMTWSYLKAYARRLWNWLRLRDTVDSEANRQEKAVEHLLWTRRFERVWLVIATCFMLAAIPVLAWQIRQTQRLTNPTNQEVVDRLIRGVNSMNRREAQEVIDTMTRKANQRR
jgi:hypothetical protein